MGRKGVEVREEGRWVFNRLAEDYRARPAYPAELVDRVAELAGGAGSTAVDLGAGTGLVAIPLARRGLRVLAVEPARAMLDILTKAAVPGVVPLHATAEATGIVAATADLAVVADALHWLDVSTAGREIARILRRGGVVALVEPRPAATPFMREVVALIESANFKARRPVMDTRREHLLCAAGAVGAREESYRDAAPLDPDALDAVLRSLSLVGPALGPAVLARLLADVRRVAAEHGGAVWEREITLTWARVH